ncbi:MAG: ATP-binding cassette domain-containing protein [Gammaproteobacteria bacterium]|nr:ATP-binding cassette domain-containing protein [Gammaproteobacteria bacterium]MCP5137222.1 ATP-binding cassette domain-containing protein [Gammaproteobacteria bacterium]
MPAVYRIRDLDKTHRSEGGAFRLRVPLLNVEAGEKIALVGPSGCGKSTLLDILALVLRPSAAERFDFRPRSGGIDIAGTWEIDQQNHLSEMRSRHIGYVLQTGGLLPYISAADNIALSLRLLGLDPGARVAQLGSELGIGDQLRKLPGMLSAGQRQRVAIARALAHKPAIVLADEPTSSLDPVTARKVMEMFMSLVDDNGVTLILATHDWPAVERFGLRALHFETGQADDGTVEGVFRD